VRLHLARQGRRQWLRDGIEWGTTQPRRLAAGDAPVYGVNTGVGLLADVRIAPSDLDQLQRNVVRWHCAGVRAMNDPTGSRLSPWLPPTLLNPSSARHGTPRGGGWGDNMCDSGCVR